MLNKRFLITIFTLMFFAFTTECTKLKSHSMSHSKARTDGYSMYPKASGHREAQLQQVHSSAYKHARALATTQGQVLTSYYYDEAKDEYWKITKNPETGKETKTRSTKEEATSSAVGSILLIVGVVTLCCCLGLGKIWWSLSKKSESTN